MSSTAIPDSTAEYDAFGPWILEVRAVDDLPALFSWHPLDLGSARLVLKVPRQIARRDAHAGMDLYEHLLVVDDEQLTVLTRDGAGYREQVIAHHEIAAIHDSVDLLDGRLTLHTLSGAALSIGYNGSSSPVVERLVSLLVSLSLEPGGPIDDPRTHGEDRPLSRDTLGRAEAGLVAAYRDAVAESPANRTLAAHGRTVVVPQAPLRRLVAHAFPTALHGAIVSTDGRRLQVFGRREWLSSARAPVSSVSRLVIPVGRVSAAEAVSHPAYRDVVVVRLRVGATLLELPFPAGAPAVAVLTA